MKIEIRCIYESTYIDYVYYAHIHNTILNDHRFKKIDKYTNYMMKYNVDQYCDFRDKIECKNAHINYTIEQLINENNNN
jgi:hypothetical protein